jgi:hypothetical protein
LFIIAHISNNADGAGATGKRISKAALTFCAANVNVTSYFLNDPVTDGNPKPVPLPTGLVV